MAFVSSDREMERIYQQSIHPESLEDENVVKTDVRVKMYHHNESRNHQKRNVRNTARKTKKTNKIFVVLRIIAILIIVFIFIGVPLLSEFKDIILYRLGY